MLDRQECRHGRRIEKGWAVRCAEIGEVVPRMGIAGSVETRCQERVLVAGAHLLDRLAARSRTQHRFLLAYTDEGRQRKIEHELGEVMIEVWHATLDRVRHLGAVAE